MKTRASVIISLLVSAGAAFAEKVIVDNTTSAPHAFTTSGTWTAFSTPAGYYGINYVAADSGTAAARWRPYIATSGVYKIYMKWTAAAARPDRAPIDIYYDGGTKVDSTRRLNQQINGGVWVYIGAYFLPAGTNNSIRIKASDDGRVCADAVLFELSYATTNSPAEPAITTPRAEYSGDYGRIIRPDAAPATVYYNGGSLSQSLTVDQTVNSDTWIRLGSTSYYMSAGTGNSVTLKGTDAGIVAADAVKFELESNTNTFVVVDNSDAGFTASGSWPSATSPLGFYGTNYAYNTGTNASATVRWRPTISTSGNYNVYIRWPNDIDYRDRPEEVQIVRTDAGADSGQVFELRLEGEPFEVKGSCGHEAVEEIFAAGGTAIRAYSTSAITPEFMRRASDAGLKVLLGIWLTPAEGSTAGFYDNPANISNQFANIKQQIDSYKNYEALLAWSIGNEIDPTTVTNPAPLYQAVEQIARYIREVDHYHPSLTAHAGADTNKIKNVIKWAPDIDIIGVNSYYPHVYNVRSNLLSACWNGPCFITEYFLRQPLTMQNETNGLTSWGGVIEPVSAEKYTKLLDIYANAILAQADRCFGSFVFKGELGAAGFRVTHTWYPILDSSLKPTPSYDAMRECWEGPDMPELTAPAVNTIKLNNHYAWDSGFMITNTTGTLTLTATVTAPQGAVLEYRAELRTNATIYTSYSPPVLTNATITQDSGDPRKFYILNTGLPNGDYRLFYYVRRTDGAAPGDYVSVGTANFPFRKSAD